MRVILEIDDTTLEKIAEMADAEKRSRKNFMELVLQSVTEEPQIKVVSAKVAEDKKSADIVVEVPDEEIPNWKKKLLEYQTKNKK